MYKTQMICVSPQMQTRAKAIITGGTMALLLLAASLVTTTFLMSPVIQQIWGETHSIMELVVRMAKNVPKL